MVSRLLETPLRHMRVRSVLRLLTVAWASLTVVVPVRPAVVSFTIPAPIVIADTGATTTPVLGPSLPTISAINSVTVSLAHEWLGDLTVKLVSPNGVELALFQHVGTPPDGSSAILGTYISEGDPGSSTFTLAPLPYQFAAAGADLAAEAEAAVATLVPPLVPDARVFAAKTWPTGPFPAGNWQLIVADSADLAGGKLTAVDMDYSEGVSSMVLSWNQPSDITYGTALGPQQLNAVATVDGAAISGTYFYTPSAGAVLGAGNHQLSVTFTPDNLAQYSSTSRTIPLNVVPAPLLVRADDKSVVAGGPLPSLTATYSGFVNGETASSLTQPISLSTTAQASSSPGAYPIQLSGGASPNYTIQRLDGTLTILARDKVVLTVTAENKTKAYGAALPTLTATYSGFVNGDTTASVSGLISLSTSATSTSPVGAYPIVLTAGDSPTYTFVLNNGIMNVTKASLVVTAEDRIKTYGDSLPAFGATYSGFVSVDDASGFTQPVTFSTAATAKSGVGTFPIVPVGGAHPNYEFVYRNGTLTVTRALLTVVPEDRTKTYGSPLPSFTATYQGFVSGDTSTSLSQPVTLSTTATVKSPPGTYLIRATGGASPNYILALNNGTLTVTKAPLQISADNKSKIYGAPIPALTVSYSGLVNGDTAATAVPGVTATTSATQSSPIGTYPITVSGGTSANYELSYVPGILSVGRNLLTVTANDVSKVYGAAMPSFSAAFSGFLTGDNASSLTEPVTFTTTATASSPAGTYPIQVSGGFIPNYDLVYQTGTLTITKAPLTITADDQSKVYGAPTPALTANFNGFVNGDTAEQMKSLVSLSTTASATTPAGSYPIKVSAGLSPNYTFSVVNGTLTVSKAPLILTADDKSKVYGAALPTFSASYAGLVNGDTPARLGKVSFNTEAKPSSGVGTYAITPTLPSNANYSLTFKQGTLTVTKAHLTVTADNANKTYGDPLPDFTATYTGLINGDTPSTVGSVLRFSTSATATSPVGTYPIEILEGTSANYELTLKPGTLTIARALLNVTAEDKTKLYGAAVPALTAKYEGFVNGDSVDSLTQPVTFVTTATTGSAVGGYLIRASGGASPNYTLALNNGTMTITKAPLTITADNKTKAPGAALPALTASFSGFVNGDSVATLQQAPSLTTTALASSPVGSYPIRVTGARASNYAITFVDGTLLVTQQIVAPKFEPNNSQIEADGSMTMKLAVSSGAKVRLEWSDDLITWVELSSKTVVADQVEFNVPDVRKTPAGFFRVVLLSTQPQ